MRWRLPARVASIAFRKFRKIRWNRHFGTNDLCEIGLFQVIKVYFWGGMAVKRARFTANNNVNVDDNLHLAGNCQFAAPLPLPLQL